MVTDFTLLTKAQRNRYLYLDDMQALAEGCRSCQVVGASISGGATLRYKDHELDDTTMYGYTPTMADIDTRTVQLGR